jgi:hypothetical protein
VQREDQAVDLERDLALVGIGVEVALLLRLHDRAQHGGLPDRDRLHQRVAHRARAVVEFGSAADVDAAGVDLDRDALEPAVEQRAQPRQPARHRHRRLEHLFGKFGVVLAHHRDLQLLARAEVGEHARLAHLGDLGHGADRQALEPDLRGQRQCGIDDHGLGLLALLGGAGRLGGNGIDGHRGTSRQKRTVVLFCRGFRFLAGKDLEPEKVINEKQPADDKPGRRASAR